MQLPQLRQHVDTMSDPNDRVPASAPVPDDTNMATQTAIPKRSGLDPDDELNNRLFFRLFQASNLYERKAQQQLGFSGVQGALLGALAQDPGRGIPLSDLVEYLAVSRQNLDGVLKRLEKKGCVRRIEDPANRRVKLVHITEAGQRAWQELFARTLEFYRQGTEGIPHPTKRAFVEVLSRVNRALRSIDLEAERPAAVLRGETDRLNV